MEAAATSAASASQLRYRDRKLKSGLPRLEEQSQPESRFREAPGIQDFTRPPARYTVPAMAGKANHRPVSKALREFALGLPEAKEDFPWGERVAKVNKKVFVFLGVDPVPGGDVGLSVKLP